MMFILYLMLGVSSFSLLNGIQKYMFYSFDCNPKYIPHWLASFIDFIDLFVTRQMWVYITIQFFWPTKSHIEEDENYDKDYSILEDEEETFDFNNITLRNKSRISTSDNNVTASIDRSKSVIKSIDRSKSKTGERGALTVSTDSGVAFLGDFQNRQSKEMQENWLAELK